MVGYFQFKVTIAYPLNNSVFSNEKIKVSIKLNTFFCNPEKITFSNGSQQLISELKQQTENEYIYEVIIPTAEAIRISASHPFCLSSTVTLNSTPKSLSALAPNVLKHFLLSTKPENISYNWTSAILLYGLNKFNNTAPSADLDLFLTTVYQRLNQQNKAVTSPDLASIALPALDFKSNHVSADITQIQEESVQFLLNEPRNILNSLNHVGNQHRFFPFFPLTKNFVEDSIWSDSIVMYALTSLHLAKTAQNKELEKFALEQPLIFAKYLQQPNGLYKHAYYYNSKELTPESSYWARGNGWQAFALIEYLADSDMNEPYKSQYLDLFNRLINGYLSQMGFLKLSPTLLSSESNNYYETSATCLFTYAITKAVRLSILPENYLEIIKQSTEDLKGVMVVESESVVLKRISWPTDSFKYDWYYTNMPTGTNISYGLGAYFLLASELELLCQEKNYCY